MKKSGYALSQKLLSWLVSVMLSVGVFSVICVSNTLSVEALAFSPRLTEPAKDDPYYTTLNPYYQSGYGMPNCTCYAYGRAYELLKSEPKLAHYSAGYWWWYNKENSIYPYGQTPKPGAVACWDKYDKSSGHVAVVEVITGDYVTLSESSYKKSYFNLGYMKSDSSNYCTSMRFLGYIYINEFSVENNPEGTFDSISSDFPETIHLSGWAFDRDNISTTLDIDVYVGGDKNSSSGKRYTIKANQLNRYKSYQYYPPVGDYHGYDADIKIGKSGTQKVYIYARNIGSRHDTFLGMKTVDVRSVPPHEDMGKEFLANIVSYETSRYVTADDDGNIVQNYRNSSENQLWHFVRNSDLSYQITNFKTGLCIDVFSAGKSDGTKLCQYKSTSGNNQQWYITKEKSWYLLHPKHAVNTAVTVPTYSSADYEKIFISTINYADTQKFSINKVDSVKISYNANDGRGIIENQLKPYDNSVIITKTIPIREGYQFLGWSSNRNAKSPQYLSGDVFSENEDIKLYAVWKDISAISFSRKDIVLGVGQKFTLKADITPSDFSPSLVWYSSNIDVAVVSSSGIVTAKSIGKTVITVQMDNGKKAVCNIEVQTAPTKVSVNKSTLILGIQETFVLQTTVTGAKTDVVYTSGNSDIATVTAEGKIKAKSVGTTIITAQVYNGKTAKCRVTVKKAPTGISISRKNSIMGLGETFYLEGSLANDEASRVLTFSSNKPEVATVTESGIVTAKSIGTAIVSITTYNGKKATCRVTVRNAPTSLQFNKTSITLKQGDTFYLESQFNTGEYARTVIYNSPDKSVATISGSGVIMAKNIGTVEITGKTYNGKTQTCTVTVK